MFLEKLDSRHLDAEDSFEMLLQIRDQSDIHRNAAARVRFAELIERLRRELPDVYQHDQGFYLEDLIRMPSLIEIGRRCLSCWTNLPESCRRPLTSSSG